MSDPRQKIVDSFQTAIPLAQRVVVTLRQQLEDATAILAALERGIAIMRTWAPPVDRDHHARTTSNLELALLRAGHAVQDAAFLAAIPEHRVRALVAGDAPTATEREELMRLLPDWRPGGGVR
jgi:hypothetical protein